MMEAPWIAKTDCLGLRSKVYKYILEAFFEEGENKIKV
jgi:hypothetical protein